MSLDSSEDVSDVDDVVDIISISAGILLSFLAAGADMIDRVVAAAVAGLVVAVGLSLWCCKSSEKC